jgi:VWFA-related protein
VNHPRSRPARAALGISALGLGLFLVAGQDAGSFAQARLEQQRPALTFKTQVDLVPVTAVVRDGKGRIVRNLSRGDFQVLEQGKPREIVDFLVSDQGPVSLAVLFDTSGSMTGANLAGGQQAVGQVLSWLDPAADEVALFTFDRQIREEVPFTHDASRVQSAVGHLRGRGQTSLYDAIASTATTLSKRPSARRAVIVITDGVDNSSAMTPADVSGLASRIDVPIYVMAVVSPLDHPGSEMAVAGAERSPASTDLASLASWTGGSLTIVSAPAHASLAARELIADLRHQYVLAFESASTPGWHALDIKIPSRDLKVRARTGYWGKG